MLKPKERTYDTPIYLQLREVLRSKIEQGEYLPGMAIPSENTLASTYGINRLTVRSAVDALVSEGLLKRVHGKGMYAVSQAGPGMEVQGGFIREMNGQDITGHKKILLRGRRQAGEKFAPLFGIDKDDSLYFTKFLMYSGVESVAIQETFIPYNLLPEIEGIDISIFSMLEIYQFYHIYPEKVCQTLELARLPQSDARLIHTSKEQAVFMLASTAYDQHDQVIEFSKTYTRGDKCCYNIHFCRE